MLVRNGVAIHLDIACIAWWRALGSSQFTHQKICHEEWGGQGSIAWWRALGSSQFTHQKTCHEEWGGQGSGGHVSAKWYVLCEICERDADNLQLAMPIDHPLSVVGICLVRPHHELSVCSLCKYA